MLSIPDMAMLGAAALLLFGPEQLPRVARKAGGFMRDIQNTSQSFIREMERAADLQEVAAKVVPPPYEPAAYDPAPYEAADEHVADGTPAYEPEPYESEPEPYDVTAHPAAATYEPPAPDPEAPVRRTVSVAEKVAEPRPALGLVEPSAPAEAPPQTNHTAHL